MEHDHPSKPYDLDTLYEGPVGYPYGFNLYELIQGGTDRSGQLNPGGVLKVAERHLRWHTLHDACARIAAAHKNHPDILTGAPKTAFNLYRHLSENCAHTSHEVNPNLTERQFESIIGLISQGYVALPRTDTNKRMTLRNILYFYQSSSAMVSNHNRKSYLANIDLCHKVQLLTIKSFTQNPYLRRAILGHSENIFTTELPRPEDILEQLSLAHQRGKTNTILKEAESLLSIIESLSHDSSKTADAVPYLLELAINICQLCRLPKGLKGFLPRNNLVSKMISDNLINTTNLPEEGISRISLSSLQTFISQNLS